MTEEEDKVTGSDQKICYLLLVKLNLIARRKHPHSERGSRTESRL